MYEKSCRVLPFITGEFHCGGVYGLVILWSVPMISYFLSISIQSIALNYSLYRLKVIVYKFSVLASITGQYPS